MKSFLNAFSQFVLGILNGFDRLVFRGHLRTLTYREGMEGFLNANGVLRKDFKKHCLAQTEKVLQASFAEAKRLKPHSEDLTPPQESKEERARVLAAKHNIQQGLICVFKCVEPCATFFPHYNRQT